MVTSRVAGVRITSFNPHNRATGGQCATAWVPGAHFHGGPEHCEWPKHSSPQPLIPADPDVKQPPIIYTTFINTRVCLSTESLSHIHKGAQITGHTNPSLPPALSQELSFTLQRLGFTSFHRGYDGLLSHLQLAIAQTSFSSHKIMSNTFPIYQWPFPVLWEYLDNRHLKKKEHTRLMPPFLLLQLLCFYIQ